MQAETIVYTFLITCGFVLPTFAAIYLLYRVMLWLGLALNNPDFRLRFFTLATLASIVFGEKVIRYFDAKTFSQDVFVIIMTAPISMFYFNHFFKEKSLKTRTPSQYQRQLVLVSFVSTMSIALLMQWFK